MRYHKRPITLLFLIFALLLLGTVEYAQDAAKASPSLHDRLGGGGYSIAPVVADFIEWMFVNDN